MAKQQRSSDIDDAAGEFSKVLPYIYAHLAGLCRRKVLLNLFGEAGPNTPEYLQYCCDVCEKGVFQMQDRSTELKLLMSY